MIQITAVHMVGGEKHDHIGSVKWRDVNTGQSDQSTRAQMVEWIEGGGKAFVTDGVHRVNVGVIKNATPKYIRTYADNVWTDNLLALPRY